MMTMLNRATALVLVLLIAAPPASARGRQAPPGGWREYANHLQLGQYVSVTLTDGTEINGFVVGLGADGLRVNPKTRIAVAIRDVGFDDIVSIEARKEGRSPGAKTLMGVGIGTAAVYLIFFLLYLNCRCD
jgi:hypothetical protein